MGCVGTVGPITDATINDERLNINVNALQYGDSMSRF